MVTHREKPVQSRYSKNEAVANRQCNKKKKIKKNAPITISFLHNDTESKKRRGGGGKFSKAIAMRLYWCVGTGGTSRALVATIWIWFRGHGSWTSWRKKGLNVLIDVLMLLVKLLWSPTHREGGREKGKEGGREKKTWLSSANVMTFAGVPRVFERARQSH